MPVIDTALSEALRILRDDHPSDSRGLSDREITKFAEDASAAYLDRGVPLDESIAKIASERGLAPNFIDRIVEVANLETYHGLLKRASPSERAHIRFALAKMETICEGIQTTGPEMSVKIASARDETMFDYMAAPPQELSFGGDYGLEKNASVATALELSNQIESDAPPHPKFARMVFDKIATGEQEIAGEVMGLRIDRGVAAARFTKTAKTLLLDGDIEMVRDIYRDSTHLGLNKIAKDLIGDAVAQVSKAMPWEKVKLGTAVDEEYLPDNFPGRVINGEQITLKLLRQIDDLDGRCSGAMRDIDQLDHTRERMAVRVLDLSQ
jgi:hypothetical protein